MRSFEVHGIQHIRNHEHLAELVISPDVRQMGMLEIDSYQKAVQVGYEAAIDPLRNWQRDKRHDFNI